MVTWNCLIVVVIVVVVFVVVQQLNQVQLLQAKISAITSQLQLKTGPASTATPTTGAQGT